MSRQLERRIAKLATTKTAGRIGYKRWNQLVNRATVADSVDELSSDEVSIIKQAEQELLAKSVNIYLDIDGVLLDSKKNKPAIGLNFFLKTLNKLMLEGNEVYWLTTHCNGDASTAVKYLAPYIDKRLSKIIIENINPTSWTVKTQGIDFTKPFLWFDDKPLGWADAKTMKDHDAEASLVTVDLNKKPLALVGLAFRLKRMTKRPKL